MKTKIQWLIVVLLTVLPYQTYAADYPIFSAYPGAVSQGSLKIDYEKVNFPTHIVNGKNNEFTSMEAKGDLYKNTYKITNVSTLKLFENYASAAEKAGFKMIFSFSPETCDVGQCKFIGNILSIEGTPYKYVRNAYYWVGEKPSSKGKIIAAWYIGSFDEVAIVHQMIVETEELVNDLIQINTNYANAIPDAPAPKELTDAEKAKDHPLLARYPGAFIAKQTKADTETFTFPFAANSPGEKPLAVIGDLTRHHYIINNVSTLKIFENYKQALTKSGFTFMSLCELEECGDKTQVNALGNQLSLDRTLYKYTYKPYYILAKKSIAGADTYVALIIAGFDESVHVHQVILVEKAVITGLVTVNADQLKQQIDEDGKALIYGIYFDTGKSTIKPESKPTLDAIAELLKRNPELLLYVVGHTDDTGSVAANLTLSQQRSKSVRDVLITDYQILATRLQAEGVGPYAPASNNTSDAGKQKNRRVELVKRLQ